MPKYYGCPCEGCGRPLALTDDIVVCPDCGAPYHRECYEKLGRCIHTPAHGAARDETLSPAPHQTDAVVPGHFGEWLQGRLGPQGPVALITLPCPVLRARARCAPAPALSLAQPDPAPVPPGRLGVLLEALGLPPRGAFSLSVEMPPGGGAGASTAALIALARAAAEAAEAQLKPAEPTPQDEAKS